MGEEASTSGGQKALREAMILLDLAITRSRRSHASLLDGGTQQPVRGCRKAAKQELGNSRSRTALQTVTLTRR
jgi:hypothetical protein